MLVEIQCPTLTWDRSLISTAAISYSLGLRHALDADHISVWSTRLNLWIGFDLHRSGNRSNDSPTTRKRSKASHRRNILLSRPFHVSPEASQNTLIRLDWQNQNRHHNLHRSRSNSSSSINPIRWFQHRRRDYRYIRQRRVSDPVGNHECVYSVQTCPADAQSASILPTTTACKRAFGWCASKWGGNRYMEDWRRWILVCGSQEDVCSYW